MDEKLKGHGDWAAAIRSLWTTERELLEVRDEIVALEQSPGYARLQAASDVPDLTFPAPPRKVVASLPTMVLHFAIQVASFQTLARAERLAQELTNSGYDARAIELNLGQIGRIVAVMVGDYATEQDATRDLTALRSQLGFSDARVEPFVTIATR